VEHKCPNCGLDDLHHSRFKSFGEKLRFNFTTKIPFRCHSCGWRGWLRERLRERLDPKTRPDAQDGPVLVVRDLMSEHDEERKRQKRRA
jgi:predicted RNA-binding Zn-ribbon protein involved in translation (DUF1610 family)